MSEINATNTDRDEASEAEDWGGRWCYGRLKRIVLGPKRRGS
jgi:hypothetical protein